MKMIVRKPGYMFDKVWNPGEFFEFNGPKSTWFAPEGEEPKPPVNVDAVLNKQTQGLSPDEKDREIANLKQLLKEAQGQGQAPVPTPEQLHPQGPGTPPHHQAEQIPQHGAQSAPRTEADRRREDAQERVEAQGAHNNMTLTQEQRAEATRRHDEAEAEAAKKAEADRRKKEQDKK